MRIILPSYEILTPISDGGIKELQRIEQAARTCYKSEDKITEDGESAKKLVSNLIKRGHEAMLEHSQLNVKFITDRGVSHELVRHRIASFAQESTRWVDYNKTGELTFALPCEFNKFFMVNDYVCNEFSNWIKLANEGNALETFNDVFDYKRAAKVPDAFYSWMRAMQVAEDEYKNMRDEGCTPQLARSVLPNSLKTEIVVTANYREWRNILKLRTAPDAHPDIRSLMIELLKELRNRIPIIFDDIQFQT